MGSSAVHGGCNHVVDPDEIGARDLHLRRTQDEAHLKMRLMLTLILTTFVRTCACAAARAHARTLATARAPVRRLSRR
eukprot:4659071-Pleurochrysis_carterae.AAC.1